MGNDTRFVEAEDLPFRLIDIPIGSAPPPPSPPIRMPHKRHAPPLPPPRVEGYDAPPSLLPPPIIPKRYDEPLIDIPQRSDLAPLNSKQNLPQKSTNHRRRKIHKRKLKCCVIS